MRSLALLVVVAACARPVQPLTEVGVTPPAIKLTNGGGAQVALADFTGAHSETIVVFYRGFF